jgi:hypothetical protein
MYTIALYVFLCVSPGQCSVEQPKSWTVSSHKEAYKAYKECAKLERKWMKEKGYVESDCYVIE